MSDPNEYQQKTHDSTAVPHVMTTCAVYNCPFCSPQRCPCCGAPTYQARPIWLWNPYTAPYYYVGTTTGAGA